MPYAVLAAALVALDQLVKYLVSHNIPGGPCPLPPPPGGADLLSKYRRRFLHAGGAHLAAHPDLRRHVRGAGRGGVEEVLCPPLRPLRLTLVLAGAVGNLIDRALQGYVVDMFNVLFMDFAIFNVADICVVVGGIAACVYYVFFYEKLEGKGTLP